MGELEAETNTLEHFAASGRAGRRNALPELQIEIDDPGAAKLAERLSDMSSHCEHEKVQRNDNQEKCAECDDAISSYTCSKCEQKKYQTPPAECGRKNYF